MGTSIKDAALTAAQREFDSYERPTWELKPTETVCKCCFLVQPCDCEA